jgi:hypothetical protein
MAYKVEGRLLEVCTCDVLCPCWVGEDPDLDYCDGLLGWHVDKGNIEGLDVSGRSIVMLVHIPGNILKGNWSVRVYVDQNATEKQKEELLKVWSGKLGGPIADMAKLVGEIVSVEKVPITFDIKGASGTIKLGDNIEAQLSPFKGATGKDTALYDTIFTTIPGSPAHVGKASSFRAKVPGFDIDIKGHNAVSGSFRFEG